MGKILLEYIFLFSTKKPLDRMLKVILPLTLTQDMNYSKKY